MSDIKEITITRSDGTVETIPVDPDSDVLVLVFEPGSNHVAAIDSLRRGLADGRISTTSRIISHDGKCNWA